MVAKTATAHGENWSGMLQISHTPIAFWAETAKSVRALLVYLRFDFLIIRALPSKEKKAKSFNSLFFFH